MQHRVRPETQIVFVLLLDIAEQLCILIAEPGDLFRSLDRKSVV